MYSCTICYKTLLFLEQGSHKFNEASISLISEKYVHVKYILRLINLIQLTLGGHRRGLVEIPDEHWPYSHSAKFGTL